MRKLYVITTVLSAVVVAFSISPAVCEVPEITIQGIPTNGILVKSMECPPGYLPCDQDCAWDNLSFTATIQDDDGIKKVSASVDGVGEVVTNNPQLTSCDDTPKKLTESTFDHNFAVKCPCVVDGVKEKSFEIVFRATDCTPYSTEKSAKLTCKCYYCVNDAWVGIDANGTTCLATLATDTNVVVQFNVLNIYEEASLVNLQLASTQGWAVDPPLPSSLLLGPGECAEFFVNVAVPGGLADGTNNIITLTGEIEGAPESASASAIIMVSDACIPTLTEWGLIIFGLVLLGFVTWAFLKRRKVVDVGA